MRSGFGILQALLVIVMVSGIMMIAMKYATTTVKQTKDMYIRESAELFLNSAVELTLLAISDRDRSGGCLYEFNTASSDQRFIADVNISRYYVYDGRDNNGSTFQCSIDRVQSIQTQESHGFVMLEVRVELNSSNPRNSDANITLTRRTLQRP